MLPAEAFAPLFAQVLLTFLVFWVMVVRRRTDLIAKRVAAGDIALRQPNWPAATTQAANAFSNQFEMPVLFYVLTILEYVTHHADNLFVILAWAFVASRYLHALEHLTTNRVMRRGAIYGVGALVLMAMWGVFAFRILTGSP